ncbi:hypothetical protein BS47DRAFT_1303615 [Hydnum rufescens UP504]|uniref:Small ribosomal subunit protein mS29 n=1 Tax=Hydnum rufescens UP504 TaxID=1448309 RepID=A0A9P6AKX5_9AGAM|nr:hypothetical protein BS47DRAFT_1303615 [Hydnum rufescens UP504]
MAHLSQPFSVIRGVTLRSYGWMNKASKYPSRDSRIVLAGTRGCGKTITLMQIADYCAAEGWVVLYVPNTMNWVNSSAPYQYDARTRTFVQPTIAHGTLKLFSTFNHQILAQLKLPADVVLDRTTVPAGATLAALAERGVLEPSEAPEVFKLLLEQLQEQREYPVLFAIDDFQALYHQSTYRDPSFNYIQAYHLSMPRLMLEYASGLKSFRRGAVVGAVSMSNYAFQLPMELRDVLGLVPFRSSNIWAKRNPDYITYAQGLRREWVPPRMNVLEAAAMTEVWEHNEALHSKLTESLFMAKMAESSGNPREFLQHGLLKTAVTW